MQALRSELRTLNRTLANSQAEWEILSPEWRATYQNDPKEWIIYQLKQKDYVQKRLLVCEQWEYSLQQERSKDPISSTDPPATSTLVRSVELEAFWRHLSTAEEEDSFVPLPIRVEFLPPRMMSLFIRSFYRILYERIFFYFDEGLLGFAITGTPGIGKSVFLFYVLWRLARLEKQPEAIVFHRAQDDGLIYLFTSNGCFKTKTLSAVDPFLSKKTTWYLTDTLDPPPTRTIMKTILVASPNRKHYKMFLKVHESVPLHYLEPWSLEELLMAAPSYNLPADIVKERYHILGGVSRHVFAIAKLSIEKTKGHISQAFQCFDFDQFSLITSNMYNAKRISHRLVHLFINESTPDCTEIYAKFGSRFILEKALNNYIQSSKAKLVDFLAVNKANPATKPLQGNLFEQFAHQQLSEGGLFKYRSLESVDDRTYDLTLPQRKVCTFYNIKECADKGSYYIPLDPNFPCIDAFVPSVGFFQMTVNVHHPIRKVQMADLVLTTEQTKLIFVVPEYLFMTYRRQSFENKSSKSNEDQGDQGISKKRKDCIEQVEQFALCIPLDIL
jgi:NADH dehydrogenase [ubiquinone] 1 alpha subcomplex assembly factor 7